MKIRYAAPVLAAAIVGALSLTIPASAATPASPSAAPTSPSADAAASPDVTPACPSGYACMWRDIHYETSGNAGHYFKMYYYAPNLNDFYYADTGYSVYKSISSEYNAGTGGDPVYYYKGTSCTGSSYNSAAKSGDSDFTNGSPSGSFNDAVESASFLSELGNC